MTQQLCFYAPQLCKLITKVDESMWGSPDYFIEPKLDGIRCLAYIGSDGSVTLINRSHNDVTSRFPEVAWNIRLNSAFEGMSAVLDGELVIYHNPDGLGMRPSFNLMQRRANRQEDIKLLAEQYPATFVAFDLIEYNDKRVHKPLDERKKHLDLMVEINKFCDVIEYYHVSDDIQLAGEATPTDYIMAKVQLLQAMDYEGVVIKRVKSYYSEGSRNADWLKYKFQQEGQFYVVGVVAGKGKRDGMIGALLLAELDCPEYAICGTSHPDAKLEYVGQVGTGFTDQQLYEYTTYLHGRKVPKRPTYSIPNSVDREVWFYNQPIRCRVKYLERAAGNKGALRFPVFKGFVEQI